MVSRRNLQAQQKNRPFQNFGNIAHSEGTFVMDFYPDLMSRQMIDDVDSSQQPRWIIYFLGEIVFYLSF